MPGPSESIPSSGQHWRSGGALAGRGPGAGRRAGQRLADPGRRRELCDALVGDGCRRACHGCRPAAPGLRVPALLGDVRRGIHPELRRPVDDCLLLGRGGQGRQPAQEEHRRNDDDGLGRLDELQPDLGHQRSPCARNEGRADDQRLCLVHRPGDHASRAPRQPCRPTQPRPPGGRGRSRPRRGWRQSRLRAPRQRLRVRVHRPAPDLPIGAQQDPGRLPADLRHDRLHRQLPDRGIGRRRGGRRDLHHGLRLSDLVGDLRRLDRSAVGSGLRSRRHRSRLHRPGPRVEGHPRLAVVWPGVVDRVERRQREEPEWDEVRREHLGQLRVRRRPRGPVRTTLGQPRADTVDRLSAPELHGHLSEAALCGRQPVRPPRGRALGPRL